MEILIRLAGVQLGPYSEEQVRQHLEDGLLSLTDTASFSGSDEWASLAEILAKVSTEKNVPVKPAGDEEPSSEEKAESEEKSASEDAPKRAPSAPPGVSHLPTRSQESDLEATTSTVASESRKTIPIGPTSPIPFSPGAQGGTSTVTTSPLSPANQSTKKVARGSLVKALVQQTSPLPTKPVILPSRPSSSGATAVPDAGVSPPPGSRKSAPPLENEMTAKTVPMRSLPGAVPSRATVPVTEPMPTRQTIKAGSGNVPPPSVVTALTKKLGQMVPPPDDKASDDDKPTEPLKPVEASKPTAPTKPSAPPMLGMPLEEAKTVIIPPPAPKSEKPATPPKEKLAEKAKSPAPKSDAPGLETPEIKGPKPILPILIYACAALALLTLYYVWSPYHAASLLRTALNNGDATELNAAIDFPSVRDSLKQEVQDQLAPASVPGAGSAALASALAMIDHAIDLYVTPEAISALVKTPDNVAKSDQGPVISPGVAANLLLAFTSHGQPAKNEGLASLSDFVLDWDVALLHLRFQGLGWKLKQINLRPDMSAPGLSDTATPLLSPVVDTYLEAGNNEMKNGNWKQAIADFSQVLAIDPQSSMAYDQRASARQSANDLGGAIKDYTQALTIDPQMAAAYNGRGNANAANNDVESAIADYNQAIQLDPNLAVAYDSRGNLKTAKDDLDGAIADYTQAIAIDPNLASAYSDRGFARQANGNLDGAIADYTQALALKPKTAMAYYNRGLARQAQGNLDAAIVDFDRALAFDPKIAGAYYSRGNAKSANHDLDGAIADYTQAVTLNPKMALGFSNRGVARQAKGDLDGAVADYTQALAVDPKIAVAYYNRAFIEEQRDDLDDAIADATQALYLDPKNAQAYNTRGFAKLAKGNLDGALSDLKQFCDMAPRDHDSDHARLYLWLIAKAQNTKTDADHDLADALENSWNSTPDDLVTKTAAFLLGRMAEADYLASAPSADAKTDQAQRCESWYFVGMKRLLLGDKKGAIDAFHQCLATQQKDFCEYLLAQAELQGLEPTPLPSAAPPPAAVPAVPAAPAKGP